MVGGRRRLPRQEAPDARRAAGRGAGAKPRASADPGAARPGCACAGADLRLRRARRREAGGDRGGARGAGCWTWTSADGWAPFIFQDGEGDGAKPNATARRSWAWRTIASRPRAEASRAGDAQLPRRVRHPPRRCRCWRRARRRTSRPRARPAATRWIARGSSSSPARSATSIASARSATTSRRSATPTGWRRRSPSECWRTRARWRDARPEHGPAMRAVVERRARAPSRRLPWAPRVGHRGDARRRTGWSRSGPGAGAAMRAWPRCATAIRRCAARVERARRGQVRLRAVRATQACLQCEGLLSPKSRYTLGHVRSANPRGAGASGSARTTSSAGGSWAARRWGCCNRRRGRSSWRRSSRVLAERVADAAGIVEDGSINLARKRNPPT